MLFHLEMAPALEQHKFLKKGHQYSEETHEWKRTARYYKLYLIAWVFKPLFFSAVKLLLSGLSILIPNIWILSNSLIFEKLQNNKIHLEGDKE